MAFHGLLDGEHLFRYLLAFCAGVLRRVHPYQAETDIFEGCQFGLVHGHQRLQGVLSPKMDDLCHPEKQRDLLLDRVGVIQKFGEQ